MSNMVVDQFLNVQEAAALIGCTEAYVRQMLISGRLPGIKANKMAWLIRLEDAEKIRDQQSQVGRPRISTRTSA